MNAGDNVRSQRAMDGPVTFNPRHIGENRRDYDHLKMTFATFLIPAMTTVLFTFINDFQMFRLEL